MCNHRWPEIGCRPHGAIWPATREFIFINIPPRGDHFLAFNRDRLEVNAAIGNLPGVIEINVDGEITCGWRVDDCKNYRADNLHFATGGYQVIAAAIKRAMSRAN